MANTKQQAAAMLDRLITLDYQTVEVYYDMGSLISSMQHGRVWETLEYTSMSHLVEEELTYTPSTAFKYAQMFRHFRRLHYVKKEAVDLLKKFGLTHMCEVLPSINDKIGQRAIKNRIALIDQFPINFTLNQKQLDKCHKALEQMGATQSDLGRYKNSSDAFMQMVENVLQAPNAPKLKVVG